jgi:hypothetical protein
MNITVASTATSYHVTNHIMSPAKVRSEVSLDTETAGERRAHCCVIRSTLKPLKYIPRSNHILPLALNIPTFERSAPSIKVLCPVVESETSAATECDAIQPYPAVHSIYPGSPIQ